MPHIWGDPASDCCLADLTELFACNRATDEIYKDSAPPSSEDLTS